MSEVAEILQEYPPDCQPTRIEPLGNAGGLSGAQFWRLVAPRGALGLRCWPIEHPSLEKLHFIHAVLRHAANRGVGFLPVPITTSTGISIVRNAGRLWELTPWLPGAAAHERPVGVSRLRSAMTALAKFHVAVSDYPVPSRFARAPAILHRLKRLRELQAGGISTLVRAIDDRLMEDLAPLARRFVAELPRAVPSAIDRLTPLADSPLPLQVCILDVWSDNVLFTGDTVTGLVDFGAVDFDTPATDVARLLGSFVGDDSAGWKDGLAAYSASRQLSSDERRAIPALDAASTVLAGCNWLRWIYVDHREFDQPQQVLNRIRWIAERVNRLGRS